MPARGGRIAIDRLLPRAAVGLGAAVALIVLLVNLVSSSGSRADPIPAWERPWISEGPTNRIALRDGWVVAMDPTDRGGGLGWQYGRFAGRPITVPDSLNPEPVIGAGGIQNWKGSLAWYRTTITLPKAGTYALRFESVNYHATVWLDGHHLGGHNGSYLPFEQRFTARAGRHTLVVRDDWRSPDLQAVAGFHRTWFNFGGIDREVTLRPIGPSDVVAPTVDTVLAPASDGSVAAIVDVTVEVHNFSRARTITPVGSLSRPGQKIAINFPSLQIAPHKAAVASALITVNNPALWSPQSPNLYELDLRVPGESEYRTAVGLRQISYSKTTSQLFLNGKPLVLRGASIQEDAQGRGDALTPQDQDGVVAQLERLHVNATRSQHPLDLGLLEKLDAAGILVWQGVGPVDPAGGWDASTPALERLAEKRVRTTVRQAEPHPSIIAWNLANEVAGNGHAGGQALYIEDMTEWLHRADPGRLVAVDIWGPHPPRIAGPMYAHVDAIGETDYLGWYEDPMVSQAALAELIRHRLGALHATFPHKLLVVSEFGAESNNLNPTNEPGGYDYQSRLLQTHIATYESLPYVSGMLVWDLRDFAVAPTFAGGSIHHAVRSIRLVRGVNQKGLLDYADQPKPAFYTVAAAFAKLAGG